MSEKGLQYLAEFQPHKALPFLRREANHIGAKNRGNKSDYYAALINYGVAQRGCGLIDEAKETIQRALVLDPQRPEAWCNMAQCCQDLGEFEKAPALFQRALQCIEKSGAPLASSSEALLGFAHSMMRLGQFQYIWPVWESARLNRSWHPFPALHPWKGEQGVRLLIVPEGGYGDAFNFLRWVRRLPVQKCTVLVWDNLFEYAKYILDNGSKTVGVQVLPLSRKFEFEELAQFTHCTPYLSLPAYSMKTWGDIPGPLDWEPRHRIVAPPNDWIGFSWRAEENGVMRAIRSLDNWTADSIGKYLSSKCERVVSLCPTGKQLHRSAVLRTPKGTNQDEPALSDFEQTARTILKCRLVVSVDTAVYHLAASLGVPVILLLPLRSDWKHGVDLKDCWYGGKVSILRGQAIAGFNDLVERLKPLV